MRRPPLSNAATAEPENSSGKSRKLQTGNTVSHAKSAIERTVKGEPDISYQGVNFLAIDWCFLETIKEALEKFFH